MARIRKRKKRIRDFLWIFKISVFTLVITIVVSLFSEKLMNKVNTIPAFCILITIILIGIVFDAIGISVTAAKEEPFHAMASDKINGAKQSVLLVRNADIISTICNDMVGDICGIVSGAAGAAIILNLLSYNNFDRTLLTVLLTSFTATLTVGGKGIGKIIAITKKNDIVFKVGLLFYIIEEKVGIKILPEYDRKS